MRVVPTAFLDLFVLEPERVQDDRGYFARTYCETTFSEHGLETHFSQWGTAHNHRAGTVRGLHYQREPYEEVKLIRCTSGAAHDVVVDVRPRSPTYLQAFATVLSRQNGVTLYVGKGFAHGYQTLEDDTELAYSMSTDYRPESATGLRWDDPAVAIEWPMPISVISARDSNWPLIGSEQSGLPLPAGAARQ